MFFLRRSTFASQYYGILSQFWMFCPAKKNSPNNNFSKCLSYSLYAQLNRKSKKKIGGHRMFFLRRNTFASQYQAIWSQFWTFCPVKTILPIVIFPNASLIICIHSFIEKAKKNQGSPYVFVKEKHICEPILGNLESILDVLSCQKNSIHNYFSKHLTYNLYATMHSYIEKKLQNGGSPYIFLKEKHLYKLI